MVRILLCSAVSARCWQTRRTFSRLCEDFAANVREFAAKWFNSGPPIPFRETTVTEAPGSLKY